MKIKSFILWQIKKWLPLFIVFILGSCFILRSGAALIDSGTLSFLGIASFVLPFFVFSERFEKNAADAYKAFPANRHQITRIKILIAAVFIVILCTVVYLVGFGLYYATYGNESSSMMYPYDQHGIVASGVSYFFLGYLFLIVFELTSFFFNCTLVSLGNYLPSSLIFLACGNALLIALVPTLIILFGGYSGLAELGRHGGTLLGMGGTYGKISFIESVLVDLYPHIGITASECSTISTVLIAILFAVEVAVGVLAFFIKEPSGEHYSQPGASNELYKIIIYANIAMAFVLEAVLTSVLFKFSALQALGIATFVGVALSSYITFAIFNKRFALKKKELIILGSIVGVALIIKIVYALIPLPNGATNLDYLLDKAQLLLR